LEAVIQTRNFALIYGILFLAAGTAGFVPGTVHPMPPGSPPMAVDQGYGMILGILPVNVLHNAVHLLFGVMGLLAFAGWMAPRLYAQVVAVAYGALVLLGLFPTTFTTFGLIPIFGNDVWLHLILAIPAAYFGFATTSMVVAEQGR